MQKNKFVRLNNNITSPQVRLVQDGEQLGIVPLRDALDRAYKAELDLVEMVPNAKPPVCEIMDYGKFKYNQKVRQKEDQRKQKAIASKEIQLRYATEQHDVDTKVRSMRKFLEEHRQVKLVVRFKARELNFRSLGESLLHKVIESVSDIGEPISLPKMEGKNLTAVIVPKKVVK